MATCSERKAGALYKVDRSCVINKKLFDQNLHNCKVEPGRRHDVCRKIPLEHLDKQCLLNSSG